MGHHHAQVPNRAEDSLADCISDPVVRILDMTDGLEKSDTFFSNDSAKSRAYFNGAVTDIWLEAFVPICLLGLLQFVRRVSLNCTAAAHAQF
jgi:hypothetical protein